MFDDIARGLMPEFESRQGDMDRWVFDSGGPGFVKEPVYDKSYADNASLETNSSLTGASGILLTAHNFMRPTTPLYERNNSAFITQRIRPAGGWTD